MKVDSTKYQKMFLTLLHFSVLHLTYWLIISVVGGRLSEGVNIKPVAYAIISLGSLFPTTYFSNFKKIFTWVFFFSSNLLILQWFHSGHKGKVFLERSRETYFF